MTLTHVKALTRARGFATRVLAACFGRNCEKKVHGPHTPQIISNYYLVLYLRFNYLMFCYLSVGHDNIAKKRLLRIYEFMYVSDFGAYIYAAEMFMMVFCCCPPALTVFTTPRTHVLG